jgi:hypothetical protein
MDVRELGDEELIAGLDKRVEFETTNEAEMIDFIREVMVRRVWLKYGADNMYDFMTRAHYHYPPSVAQRKTDAARIMEVFPEVKELMLAEELNVSQLGMLATALRQKEICVEKQREVLELMRGQTIENTRVSLNEAFEMEGKKREKIRRFFSRRYGFFEGRMGNHHARQRVDFAFGSQRRDRESFGLMCGLYGFKERLHSYCR